MTTIKTDGFHTYRVIWHVLGQDRPFQSDVQIIDGYSTLSDLPNILAIAYLGSRNRAPQITVLLATEQD